MARAADGADGGADRVRRVAAFGRRHGVGARVERCSGDAGAVLRAFVAAEDCAGRAKYRNFRTDGLSGVRVDYVCSSRVLNEGKKESALTVVTPRGPVVLHLGGLDSEEHEEMLPAFELAQETLHTT
ncbi:lipoprotein [Streptomyces sp. NPDC101234]|uniref:lipoprotein n=1 Tax=Streptomyces sp. NPDC101234 TaxID=3366138 RepID=UPI00381758C4